MKFTKMQGIGNDYIYINCFEETITDPSALSVKLSDRHFGIGSDGIILISPSKTADCKMDIYNADGSQALMCGNGIRCVGKYVYEREIARKSTIYVETLSGVKALNLHIKDDKVISVCVNMGTPGLTPTDLPADFEGSNIIDRPLAVNDQVFNVTCVSMGNPHCVLFVDDVDSTKVSSIGPLLEKHPAFPQRANIEFVQIINKQEIRMRVWERGSGETWACGTGACASAVACVLNNKIDRKVKVHLRGGDLDINWDEASNQVFMDGPAEFVFDGNIKI